jgi:hypothetical protein
MSPNIPSDNRALTTLILKDNRLLTPEAGKVLSDMLAANTVLKELDVSSNNWEEYGRTMGDGPGFAKELAVGIPGKGALLSRNLARNNLGELVLPMGWERKSKDNDGMAPWFYQHTDGTKQDNRPGKPEGAIAIANALPGMGALSIANVLGNRIGKEMLSQVQEIMRSKPKLIYLCGIADDATEADLSGLGMDGDDAIVLASELPDKGAMTSLNLASNKLGVEGAKIIAACLPKCT